MFRYNPLIFSGFDITGGSSATSWLAPVPTKSALPTSGNLDGDTRVALDTDKIYVWNAANSIWVNNDVNTASVGATPNLSGYSFTPVTTSGVEEYSLILQPADASNPGVISTGSQNISGPKTFGATVYANAGIDVVATAGADTLSIGGTNADVINIGNSGCTVNIQGTTLYENVTQLQVTDPLITINKGGATGSAANSGLELEEAGNITGFLETSSDRNSWQLKAPNTAGVVTFVPGSAGFTINQGSHNPVTIGTASGLSLANQALSLGLASSGVTGALSGTDWNTFNNKVSTTRQINTTAPLLGGGDLSADRSLSISKATTGADGYLASTDFNTFNNKVATTRAINTTGPLTGGGDLSSDRTISIPAATGSTDGYLSAGNFNTFNNKVSKSSGDLDEMSFTGADNQVAAANITGFNFNPSTVRSVFALVSVTRGSTYSFHTLQAINKGASWELNREAIGDETGVVFSMNAGQIQYTSTSTGATPLIKFRAFVTQA